MMQQGKGSAHEMRSKEPAEVSAVCEVGPSPARGNKAAEEGTVPGPAVSAWDGMLDSPDCEDGQPDSPAPVRPEGVLPPSKLPATIPSPGH